MAIARTHDRWTILAAIALTVGAVMANLTWEGALTLGVSELVGGFFLSPDLDIRSVAYRRWGWLRWWWKPYQRIFCHRHFLTHAPFFGILFRLLWLFPLWFPFLWWGKTEMKYIVAVVVGVEASAIVHWAVDFITSVSLWRKK